MLERKLTGWKLAGVTSALALATSFVACDSGGDGDDITDDADASVSVDDDGEPDDGEPDDDEPDDDEPDDGEPDDGEPDDGEPDDGEPDDGEPDDGEPDDGGTSGGDGLPLLESGDEVTSAQGGRIVLGDGAFELWIPPGALSEDTAITAEVQDSAELADDLEVDAADVLSAVRLEPDGLEFAVPVAAIFRTTPPADATGESSQWAVISVTDDATYVPSVAGVNEDDEYVFVGELEHFSSVAAVRAGKATLTPSCVECLIGPHDLTLEFELWLYEIDYAYDLELTGGGSVNASGDLEGDRWAAEDRGRKTTITLDENFTCDSAGSGNLSIAGRVSVEEVVDEESWATLLTGIEYSSMQIDHDIECVCNLEEPECGSDMDCSDGKTCLDSCVCACENGCQTDADCGSQETCNSDTCACEGGECELTDDDCPPYQQLNEQTCMCECSQLQNCSGATPHWNADACQCECQASAGDCSGAQVFSEDSCACQCPEDDDIEGPCKDLESFNPETCGCECPEEVIQGGGDEWCETGGYVFDAESCDCVCGLTADDCSGNTTFDAEACACVCPEEGEHRECSGDGYFEEESCSCACDLDEACDPDFARNPDTCECECILDEEASCSTGQVLDTDTCLCGCADQECPSNKALNPDNCACECSQLQTCTEPFVWSADTCECVCEVSQTGCPEEAPYLDPTQCGCVSNIMYLLEGRPISYEECDDDDAQIQIANVTETTFDIVGLDGSLGPIKMTIAANGRTATATNVIINDRSKTLIFSMDEEANAESGMGSLQILDTSGGGNGGQSGDNENSCYADLAY